MGWGGMGGEVLGLGLVGVRVGVFACVFWVE
jgi:hypothetical protein